MEWVDAKIKISKEREKFKETNDCTVIAWTNVFDCEYSKAHSYLKKFGRPNRKGMYTKQIRAALEACTKAKIKIGPYDIKNKISVSNFVKKHSKGRYYVLVRGHAFAIKDGIVYDYYDGPRRQINFACRVYLEGEI